MFNKKKTYIKVREDFLEQLHFSFDRLIKTYGENCRMEVWLNLKVKPDGKLMFIREVENKQPENKQPENKQPENKEKNEITEKTENTEKIEIAEVPKQYKVVGQVKITNEEFLKYLSVVIYNYTIFLYETDEYYSEFTRCRQTETYNYTLKEWNQMLKEFGDDYGPGYSGVAS